MLVINVMSCYFTKTLFQETLYPSYCLDLMVLCWSQQPKDRPSASQIVSIASAPEFTHLSDVASLKHSASVVATASAPVAEISGFNLIKKPSQNFSNLCNLQMMVYQGPNCG